MNIITNKEVFSDENQAKIPKKVERRRGRPRKNPANPATPTSAPPTNPNDPAKRPEQPKDSTQPSNAPAKKTVFYQAARPRRDHRPNTAGSPRPPQPNRPAAQPLPHQAPATPARPQFGTPFFPQNTQHTPSWSRPNTGEKLRIIPLGGLEEIGKNMTIFEYGNDILIVDMGLLFPDYDMPGIDYIIPDVSYLDDKKDRIRGVFITHGHLDHIGAVPYLIERIGFPNIYGTNITIGMVKQRLEEFNLIGRNKLVTVEPEKDILQLGAFRLFPFRLIHSIPGSVGLEIETPNGRVAYCTDWKFDYQPANNQPVDFRTLAMIGARGVDLLLSDSTNAEKPGHSVSEKVIETSINEAISEAKGRIIIAMFATNLNRIQQTLNVAHRNNRKVLIVGRSMQQNVEMAVGLKAIQVPPNTLISERELNRFSDEQVIVLCTGSQGEDNAALSRIANGEHRIVKMKKGDTVIISASPIPGNEKSVSIVMDMLYKAGAHVIYNKVLDVHTSGHANQEDLKLMIALTQPKYFLPLHGERSKLVMHGKLATEVGVNPENILIGENGHIVEMGPEGKVYLTESHVPAGHVMVDGLGVGDVGNIVLRDRQAMAKDGIFVVISVLDKKARKFITSPDIISRGFIYMRENEQFVNDIRNEIKSYLSRSLQDKKADVSSIKNDLREYVSKMLYEKTERQPIVIPVIIET